MQFELVNVSALRIILQQPSCVWKEFKIEDLKIYRSSESGRPNPLPAWLTDTPSKSGKKKVEGVTNLEALSSTLQQLWALSEEVAAQQTNRALGRYEVDGCYEINLLSYT
ncbi:nicolin-1-like isoform X2 [Ruditapes philippinarum]|uniref:nicolin-1-like isoform X2 n=1 Tax=Ruditapes philippinarum TaxID=129788 RepID=UPI00295B95DB|nr:nicolin-1-like isoform X2 [Ruditapes philippinarum]